MRVAILGNTYFSNLFYLYGIDSISLYKRNRLLRRFIIFMRKFYPSFLKGCEYKQKWLNAYVDYDVLLVFDYTFLDGDVEGLKYIINNVSTTTRLIYFHWNIISDNEEMLKTLTLPRWEHWTFDIGDAKKYNIKFANTLYMKELIGNGQNGTNRIDYDVMFIGVDKVSRRKIVNEVKNVCKKENLKALFYIVSNSFFSHRKLSYKETIAYTKRSKAIIEILKPEQEGLSLRTLESIFLNKKLITNNKSIKKYSFYRENNIYILSEDKRTLSDFLNEDYEKINDYEISRYLFYNWINRIIDNEEAVI